MGRTAATRYIKTQKEAVTGFCLLFEAEIVLQKNLPLAL